MKWISMIIIFASIKAFSCPNLEGEYSCVEQGQEAATSLTIAQSTIDEVTTYSTTRETGTTTYIADNKTKDIVDEGVTIARTLVYCNETSLVKVIRNMPTLFEYYFTFSIDQNSQVLTIDKSDNIVGADPADIICEKQ